jgi:hypothetical protein
MQESEMFKLDAQPQAKKTKHNKAMTPVRACQVASRLLTKIEVNPELASVLITIEEREAIQVLRDTTAKVIVHGLQRR